MKSSELIRASSKPLRIQRALSRFLATNAASASTIVDRIPTLPHPDVLKPRPSGGDCYRELRRILLPKLSKKSLSSLSSAKIAVISQRNESSLLCFVGFDAFVLRLARLFRQFLKRSSRGWLIYPIAPSGGPNQGAMIHPSGIIGVLCTHNRHPLSPYIRNPA